MDKLDMTPEQQENGQVLKSMKFKFPVRNLSPCPILLFFCPFIIIEMMPESNTASDAAYDWIPF